jgi:hypothetical protein
MKRTNSAARGKGVGRQHKNKGGATPGDPTNARKPQAAASRAAAPPADPKERHLKVPQLARRAPPADPKETHLKVSQQARQAPPADPEEGHLGVPQLAQQAPPADPEEGHLGVPRRPR